MTDQGQRKTDEPTPIEIISKRINRGKNEYRVKYSDRKVYLCDWVNKALLDHYKRQQTAQSTNNVKTDTST